MNPPKLSKIISRLGLIAAAGMVVFSSRADLLELTNGDHYRGTVISMTQSTLEFQSEIQGRVKLPREKVARITFHEAAVSTSSTTGAPVVAIPQAGGPPMMVSGAAAAANQSATPDAVVKQMREQGIDPKIVKQVQEQIFGKASPEAAQKFNETMDGLLSGKLSVQDIRAQAVNSIKLIKETRKELGDDAGDMLDGYLAILEKFVQETDSGASTPAPTSTATPSK